MNREISISLQFFSMFRSQSAIVESFRQTKYICKWHNDFTYWIPGPSVKLRKRKTDKHQESQQKVAFPLCTLYSKKQDLIGIHRGIFTFLSKRRSVYDSNSSLKQNIQCKLAEKNVSFSNGAQCNDPNSLKLLSTN